MQYEREQEFVIETRKYVSENFPLSKMSDEELEEKVEELVVARLKGEYCSIEQKI